MTRILVTRPAAQAESLSSRLRERAIEVVDVPTVEIDATSTAADLDAILGSLSDAAWLVLTSANGADALVARLHATDRVLPASMRVAAVGPATADVLRGAGIGVDHVPDRHLTVEIAAGIGDVAGRRVVLARADAATPDLRDALLARGAHVTEVVAYRTVEGPESSRADLGRALLGALDGIAFTSGSTVRGLVRLADDTGLERARHLRSYCIGPVTAAEARRAGLRVAGVASTHTAAGLAALIADTVLMETA